MWVKVEDAMPEHPKFLAVGDVAGWLFVCGLCYCVRNETNGEIPAAVVPRLITSPTPKPTRLLVKEGLWHKTDEGYDVHDYLAYQPSSQAVSSQRDKARERQQRHRESRERNGVSHGHVTDVSQRDESVTPRARASVRASSSALTVRSKEAVVARELCDLLADLILARDPKAKVNPGSKAWVDAARLLMDRDGRSRDEVEAVIRWCQADPFWQPNILSMPKLREKFDQLVAKMKAPVRESENEARRRRTRERLAA